MCAHQNTQEMLLLGPGILMCADCGALFDVFDPYNEESLEVSLTPGQLKGLIVKAIQKACNAS